MFGKKNWTLVMMTGILAVGMTGCGGKAPVASNNAVGSETSKSSPAAPTYPTKPLTVMVPNAAAGGLDTNARVFTKILTESKLVTQSMTIENKPGGGQAVGLAEYVIKEEKNDYMLFFPSSPLIINNFKKEGNSPYSFRDLTPLAQLTEDYVAIAVKSDSKYTDLKSLIDDLKAKPDSIVIAGGSGPGSTNHLGALLPALKAGIAPKTIKYLSFDGGGQAMTALLGGNAAVVSVNPGSVGEFLKAGKVKVLGISSPKRLAGDFKDIPTFKEQGFDITYANWRGVFGPKNMSPEAVKYWDTKLKALSENEAWKTALKTNGWDDGYKNASDFKANLEKEEELTREILKTLDMLK